MSKNIENVVGAKSVAPAVSMGGSGIGNQVGAKSAPLASPMGNSASVPAGGTVPYIGSNIGDACKPNC